MVFAVPLTERRDGGRVPKAGCERRSVLAAPFSFYSSHLRNARLNFSPKGDVSRIGAWQLESLSITGALVLHVGGHTPER